jgi:hypothetical protein
MGERQARLDQGERRELIDELLVALEERSAGDGGRLLELMRAEQNIVDALTVIRREIDIIVRGASARAAGS